MVKTKAFLTLMVALVLGLAGALLWGSGQAGKAKAQARALDALDARLEALEGSLEQVRKQVATDKAQADARYKATQAVLQSAATTKEKLRATPALTLSPADADSLREHTDALNQRIRAARSLPGTGE